ncbi:MAG: 1,4-dihydroxy-2-naphthoate octaprenyltransferase [Deltaproteobacteria bacterium]|nr:1,4-dihydroxy-2-naphthoate octaprenyltransferase [Deltaproteobacteria bacterium]
MKLEKMGIWFLAARPKTLTASMAPVLVGTAVAVHLGYDAKWWIAGLALVSAIFIQIGTNLLNDVIDFQKGIDAEERLGPTRAAQSGLLSIQELTRGAVVSFGIAVLIAIPLIIHGGWPILVIGLLSLLFGYTYSGGPYPLSSLGIAEVFVLLFFGWIAVVGTTYLHTGQWVIQSFWAGTQVGLLSTVMLAINNLRDVTGDTKAGKKTLAVRFGIEFARIEIAFLSLFPFALGYLWFSHGGFAATLFPFLTLPLAGLVVRGMLNNPPSPKHNRYLALASLLALGFSVLLAGGLFLG